MSKKDCRRCTCTIWKVNKKLHLYKAWEVACCLKGSEAAKAPLSLPCRAQSIHGRRKMPSVEVHPRKSKSAERTGTAKGKSTVEKIW